MGQQRQKLSHIEHLKRLDAVAAPSRHPRVKVGCIIVDADSNDLVNGYNDFPHGVSDVPPERSAIGEFDYWIEHAERNAIYAAARAGITLAGATIYIHHMPCSHCARAIIQSGIAQVVCPPIVEHMRQKWEGEFARGRAMLAEAGVELVIIEPLA